MTPSFVSRLSVMARSLATILFSTVASQSGIAGAAQAGEQDPHYNDAGFFDIHVCNWPGRPLFLMPLFSTEHFSEVQQIEVMDPAGKTITLHSFPSRRSSDLYNLHWLAVCQML